MEEFVTVHVWDEKTLELEERLVSVKDFEPKGELKYVSGRLFYIGTPPKYVPINITGLTKLHVQPTE